MNTQKSIKYCKDKIEEYEKEISKLEKQKMEYLEVDKVPPSRIIKRIGECNIIITYFEELLHKINECENQRITAQNSAIPRFYNLY